MKAAVVNSFDVPPSFEDYREPEPKDGETVLTVEAAALSPIVKRLAAGEHYSSTATAGFVPGVDGVGIDANGQRVYFLFPKAPFGSMAERSLAATSMTVPVPDPLASDQAAAIVTAALASWVALTRRAKLLRNETVLVLGATGASGSMAIQTARFLGARKIVAVGRNAGKLERLDADVKISLENGTADAALSDQFDGGINIVLDFVWGEPANRVLRAATQQRGSPMGEPTLRYVQLGTMAGDGISIRGDMLRSSGLLLMGSGIGSVAVADLLAGAGELLAAAPEAKFHTDFQSLPLRMVEDAWRGDADTRYVLLPGR
ncbi:MAG: zinc-binding alcohol dehydrogenase family protein [Alphaproteobacteria bacterium]|jgi:NADPH:quinone reductase-like Zn-dependent oxidoreductase|nr:zinc-binding alcohol dehydrogenase family protein [Alphaproteobacteria bacterium]MBU1551641.1 zinc-binding alcohol dehydrogenase family protein [Alphaproteobacteria bacterium]MBU2337376.1 zinc-binding alcohol dehydrogenase family protein [Alphaproteobacteria bacterium]MBU2388119.1 zinc-binding alcohol dehydrogenase family protein [Alphaproteobacteria bacterium]